MPTIGYANSTNAQHRHFQHIMQPYNAYPILRVRRPSPFVLAGIELGDRAVEAIEDESTDYLTEREHEGAVLRRAEEALRTELSWAQGRVAFLEYLVKAAS